MANAEDIKKIETEIKSDENKVDKTKTDIKKTTTKKSKKTNETVKIIMLKNVNICERYQKDFGGIKRFEYNKVYDMDIDIADEWFTLGRCEYVHNKDILQK